MIGAVAGRFLIPLVKSFGPIGVVVGGLASYLFT
jgi:hypothetical protein